MTTEPVTTHHKGYDVTVEPQMITVGTNFAGDRIWLETELDNNGDVISFLLMTELNGVQLHLDKEEYIMFSNMMFHTSGERLRLTVNKIKKSKGNK